MIYVVCVMSLSFGWMSSCLIYIPLSTRPCLLFTHPHTHGTAAQQGQRPQAAEVQQELSREDWSIAGANWMNTALSALHMLIKL